MGKLLDFLKRTAGEASLHSGLGLWRQKVSAEVDALSSEPDYSMAALTGQPQTIVNLANATTIAFNDLISSSGSAIQFLPLTGEFRLLTPGYYELDARLFFEGWDTVATDIATFFWRDVLGNDLAPGALGLALPMGSGQNLSTQATIKALVRVTTPTTVLVAAAGGQGGCDVAVGSFVTVRKVA
ncbi:MAG: hypothetical protein AMXMBFR56_67860 [Polyangiaceae bacterium]